MTPPVTAHEQTETVPPQLCLRTARALFEALTAAAAPTRLSALQAVRLSPATALSFGLYERRDVIDVLLERAQRWRGTMEWVSWIGALAAFRDVRVVRLFVSLVSTEDHGGLLFALAEYLRNEPAEALRPCLAPALMQNECASRARAVAHLLAGSCGGCAGERLRIQLLESSGEVPLPPFSEQPAAWLAELDGLFQWEARAALRAQGPATLAALAPHWEEFSTNNGAWLLEWAANDDPALAADLMRKALSTGPRQLAAAALTAASKLPETPGYLSGFAVPFLSDRNELVRRAAVLCCCDLDFGAFFETESSVLVKQACLAKLARIRGVAAIPELSGHLRSADWRIRAAAADALLFLGHAAVRAAIELVPVAGEPVRTAVARMVASCADEDLLEAYLRACGAG
ncbi:MAG: hypothetical protein JO033_13505 [Acidobacteriaceae bacterium]|nr:hypothetical protein [Acidobacteriaceae bacterium]MBV9502720.1 hypothetical protein [Acidobacteriaceae bacterium]